MSDSLRKTPGAPDLRAATRARLLARAAADATVRRLPLAGSSRAVPQRGLLLAALAASLVFAFVSRMETASLRDEAARERSARLRLADSLGLVTARGDSLLAALTGPAVRVMRLTATTARTASAFMFWDTAHARWTFVAHDVPAARPGRGYQVWLVTSDARISVGMLPVNPAGIAMLQVTHALPEGALRAVAVTEEPASGSPQPTSAPLLAAVAGS